MARRTKKSNGTYGLIKFTSAISLMMVSAFCALSLMTYNPYDPSYNLATNAVVKNAGGSFGAYISGPALEFIGLGCIIFVLIPLAWGIQLLRKDSFKQLWLKVTFFIVAIPSVASLFTLVDYIIDAPESWPSDSFGGLIGMIVRNNTESLIGVWGFAFAIIITTITTIFFAAGLPFEQWSSFFRKIKFSLKFTANKIKNFTFHCNRIVQKIISKIKKDKTEDHSKKIKNPKRKITRKNEKIEGGELHQIDTEGEKQQSFDMEMKNSYQLPPLDLLSTPPRKPKNTMSESSLSQNAEMLEKVLDDFGIKGKIVEVNPGPVVTLYALEPAAGTKSARVIGLANDIARSMSADSARIAVIPGKNAIGIELPNSTREIVYLKPILSSKEFRKGDQKLPLTLGKNISGEAIVIDLAKTPHLLVAGTTGSGKSVGLNAMILSLLYKYSPDECKFIMVDPKMLELSVYQDIPHLLTPVVTEPGKAVVALKWTVKEMENRYRLMSNLNVRNINGYNEKIAAAKKNGETLTRSIQTGFHMDTGKPIIETVALDMNPLPYIVVIVDEMADLMMVGGKDIEISIQRLAQMARAAGIHVILATQRPSVDVITGIIKANFPTRISFQVTSKIDSRTILGEQGAEQLLGMGDMLYMAGGSRITRVHGPFVDDNEVERVANFLKKQAKPLYIEDVTIDEDAENEASTRETEKDELYDQAVAIVLRDRKASTSYIQRALKIGYNRAANIIEEMEREGVISKADHVGRREIVGA